MNHRLSWSVPVLTLLAIVVAGCSIAPDSKKIEYKSAGKVPSLEVPPDLTQVTRDDRYAVPDAAGKGSATFSAYTADRTPAAQAKNSGSRIKPYLITSEMPAFSSRAGSVSRVSMSARTSCG